MFFFSLNFIFNAVSLWKWLRIIAYRKRTGETYRNKHLLNQKNGIVSFPHFWAGFKDFKGSVANRALSSLHGGSLEITLTVPLTFLIRHTVCSLYLTVNKIFSLNLYYLYLQVKMYVDLRNVPPVISLTWTENSGLFQVLLYQLLVRLETAKRTVRKITSLKVTVCNLKV